MPIANNRPLNHNPQSGAIGSGGTGGGNGDTVGRRPNEIPARRKTDEELLEDAQRLHAAFLLKYENLGRPESADATYDKKTVAVAEFNGELVFAVSSNGTSPELLQLAEDMGYRRISGSRFLSSDPKQTHAEQILLNAYDQGDLNPPGTIAPSREYCDLNPASGKTQGCNDRISQISDDVIRGVPFREVWP